MAPSDEIATTLVGSAWSQFAQWGSELERLARAGVQEEIAQTLALGIAVHFTGLGRDAGKLFKLLPDGRTFEYRVCSDGTREIVREVSR